MVKNVEKLTFEVFVVQVREKRKLKNQKIKRSDKFVSFMRTQILRLTLIKF